jgi:hypothetical protein
MSITRAAGLRIPIGMVTVSEFAVTTFAPTTARGALVALSCSSHFAPLFHGCALPLRRTA